MAKNHFLIWVPKVACPGLSKPVLVSDDIRWYSVVFNGIQWYTMVYNGIQWFSMVSDGLGWSHMGLRWGGVGLGWTSECAEVIIIVMKIKNMYFHAVKSTAHPPFIGAVGHSTDCIVKQSYTFGPNDLASGHQTVTKWSPSCH